MSVDIKMHGIEDMQRRLKELGTKKALRAPAAAVRAGSKIIINKSRSAAPIDTGTLKKSLGQKIKTFMRRSFSSSSNSAKRAVIDKMKQIFLTESASVRIK